MIGKNNLTFTTFTHHIKNLMVGPSGMLFCILGLPASTWLAASLEEVKSLKVSSDVTRNAIERTVAPVLSAIFVF